MKDARRGVIFSRRRKEMIKKGKQEAEGELIDAEGVGRRRAFEYTRARRLMCFSYK